MYCVCKPALNDHCRVSDSEQSQIQGGAVELWSEDTRPNQFEVTARVPEGKSVELSKVCNRIPVEKSREMPGTRYIIYLY